MLWGILRSGLSLTQSFPRASGVKEDVVTEASAWPQHTHLLVTPGHHYHHHPSRRGKKVRGAMCNLRLVCLLDDLGSWISWYFGSNHCSNLQPTSDETVTFYRMVVSPLYLAQDHMENSFKQRFPGFHPELLVQWVGPKNLVPSSSQVPGTTLWQPLIYKAITCPYGDWKYLANDKIWILELLLLHEGLCTNTIGITGKFVRNAESQVLCQTCWFRICILTGSLHESFAFESLRNTPQENLMVSQESHRWKIQIPQSARIFQPYWKSTAREQESK